jgi:aryl carrier-like protein
MFPLEVCNQGTILIVGDFTGLELTMSRWMIEKRAVKRLVLLSQRTLNQLEQPDNPQYKEWLRLKRVANEHNAHVNVAQADLTNFEQVHKLIETLGQTSYSVRGIILSAVAAENRTLSQLTQNDLTRAFAIKIRGAWHLHQASQLARAPLHFFVLFSSIRNHLHEVAAGSDNAGNQFLDALVLYRSRQLHLPALSVSLPVVSDVSIFHRDRDMSTHPQKIQVCEELTPTAMFELIERFHVDQTNCPCPIVFAVNWKNLEQTVCKASSYQLFKFVEQRRNAVDRSITSSGNINATDSIDSSLETIAEQIQTAVARLLGLTSVDRISVHRSIISQGMDSLTALALYNWLGREMNVFVPLVILLQDIPIQSIATYVYDKLKEQPI